MDTAGAFVADGFKQWWFKDNNGKKFSRFLELTKDGKDSAGNKTMIELAEDPSLSNSDKSLLNEYISLSNETSQDIDPDVKRNPSAMA